MSEDRANEVQRSLGRIEGKLDSTLAQLKELGIDFGKHKDEDVRSFSLARTELANLRDAVNDRFEEHARTRNVRLSEQDAKLDAITQTIDKSKGAGWVILGIIGAAATFIGGAVIAVLGGWIKL